MCVCKLKTCWEDCICPSNKSFTFYYTARVSEARNTRVFERPVNPNKCIEKYKATEAIEKARIRSVENENTSFLWMSDESGHQVWRSRNKPAEHHSTNLDLLEKFNKLLASHSINWKFKCTQTGLKAECIRWTLNVQSEAKCKY